MLELAKVMDSSGATPTGSCGFAHGSTRIINNVWRINDGSQIGREWSAVLLHNPKPYWQIISKGIQWAEGEIVEVFPAITLPYVDPIKAAMTRDVRIFIPEMRILYEISERSARRFYEESQLRWNHIQKLYREGVL